MAWVRYKEGLTRLVLSPSLFWLLFGALMMLANCLTDSASFRDILRSRVFADDDMEHTIPIRLIQSHPSWRRYGTYWFGQAIAVSLCISAVSALQFLPTWGRLRKLVFKKAWKRVLRKEEEVMSAGGETPEQPEFDEYS